MHGSVLPLAALAVLTLSQGLMAQDTAGEKTPIRSTRQDWPSGNGHVIAQLDEDRGEDRDVRGVIDVDAISNANRIAAENNRRMEAFHKQEEEQKFWLGVGGVAFTIVVAFVGWAWKTRAADRKRQSAIKQIEQARTDKRREYKRAKKERAEQKKANKERRKQRGLQK